MQHQNEPPGMSEEVINDLKEFSGIEEATCNTCAHGTADIDGDYAQIYCGTVCSKLKGSDHTYVEDAGIDPNEEHLCWAPDYWCSDNGGDFDFEGTDKEVDEAIIKSIDLFNDQVDKIIGGEPCATK